MWCSVVQSGAVWCNVLQFAEQLLAGLGYGHITADDFFRRGAMCSSVLQCGAV